MTEQKPNNLCSSIPIQFPHKYSTSCATVESQFDYMEGLVQGLRESLKQPLFRDIRKELWVGVAIAVAQASNSTNKYTMASWADQALDAFDKRFKESNQ